jgi:SAM-dependent methyltransferase
VSEAGVIGDSAQNSVDAMRKAIRAIPALPPYDAALAYRDVVRAEVAAIRERIPDMATRGKYEKYIATYFRPQPRGAFTDHNWAFKLTPVLDLIRASDVRRVLDGACGNGFEAVLFALHGKDVVANDCSPERVAITALRAAFYRELCDGTLSLTVTRRNIADPRVTLGVFDCVFVQEAISHIHPAEDFLALTKAQYLTPSGHLVICDSNGWNPVTRLRIMRHLWHEKRTLRHYVVDLVDADTGERFQMAEERLFNPIAMRNMLRRAGLRPEQCYMSGFLSPAIVHRSLGRARRIERRIAHLPGVRWFGGFYTVIAQN